MLKVQFISDFLIKVKDVSRIHPKSKITRFVIVCGRFYHIPFRIDAIEINCKKVIIFFFYYYNCSNFVYYWF